jgi:hypothetical protein
LHAEASECHLDIFFNTKTISTILHGNLKDTLHALVDLEPLKDRDCLGSLLSQSACKGWNVDMLEDSFKFNNTTVDTWEVIDGDICQSDSLNQLLVCIVRVTGKSFPGTLLELLEITADGTEECREGKRIKGQDGDIE